LRGDDVTGRARFLIRARRLLAAKRTEIYILMWDCVCLAGESSDRVGVARDGSHKASTEARGRGESPDHTIDEAKRPKENDETSSWASSQGSGSSAPNPNDMPS
jgi:hypothetical protein